MPSPLPRRAHQALVRRLAESRRVRGSGEVLGGHHNINYILPLGIGLALLLGTVPFARAKLRVPLKDRVEVVPRIWPSEAEVLRVVSRHLREVPRCLADFGDGSLHAYRRGKALSEEIPDGDVDDDLMGAFADFFVRTAGIPVAELPPRPADWPDDGDSQRFLHWLVDFTEERVHRANRDRFGSLFDDVLIPEDAMATFKRDHTGLTSRPFRLLHTDVHRANVVMRNRRLAVIDWELAIYGDPLHELATHLVRMGYGKQERDHMTELWAKAMRRAGYDELTEGLDDDLPVYVAFEYAQSVFPDVMRAALGLPEQPDEVDFREAGRRICVAMGLAREPLQLMDVPDLDRAVKALRSWHDRNVAARSLDGTPGLMTMERPERRERPEGLERPERRDVVTRADEADSAQGNRAEQRPHAGHAGRAGGGSHTGRAGHTGRATRADQTKRRQLNDPRALREIAQHVTTGRCVLFDFDGPLCRLFPDEASAPLARELRRIVALRGAGELLTAEARASVDPQVVLRAVDRARPAGDLVAELEERLAEGEAAAAAIAPSTPGADLLVCRLAKAGIRMGVATNNSPEAVAVYLRRVHLHEYFEGHIHGRTDDPRRLKPDPDSLQRALRSLEAEAYDALMIGDMPTDLEAAREAKVPFVGYARDEKEAGPLWDAGAQLVVSRPELLSAMIPLSPS
ncbi:HAD-IA family hydrolase [Streptomyces sp. NPDC050564]|uniref:HAD-IA family hydrolase n=1 Tax=Streptomyces sp. NPDC050564 TaxID=3365631 RepID=UPI0037B9232B